MADGRDLRALVSGAQIEFKRTIGTDSSVDYLKRRTSGGQWTIPKSGNVEIRIQWVPGFLALPELHTRVMIGMV